MSKINVEDVKNVLFYQNKSMHKGLITIKTCPHHIMIKTSMIHSDNTNTNMMLYW